MGELRHGPRPRQTRGRWRVDCSCGWEGRLVPLPGQGYPAWADHHRNATSTTPPASARSTSPLSSEVPHTSAVGGVERGGSASTAVHPSPRSQPHRPELRIATTAGASGAAALHLPTSPENEITPGVLADVTRGDR